MSTEENKIIIGLDFGTTFSGVAYCDSSRGPDDVNAIQLITSWPGMSNNTNEKVPTRICYSSNGKTLWGNMIKPSEKGEVHALMKLQLDGPVRKSKQWKLLLALLANSFNGLSFDELDSDEDSDGEEAESTGPLKTGVSKKDPVDIVSDYLTEMRKFVWEELEKQHDHGLFSSLKKELVVTVPAVWSERAKDQTLKAVTKSKWGTSKISLVTEPEAAAIYTLKWMTTGANKENVSVGDSFVLCDAGGGTVDLISYEITRITPSFKVEEATVGSGDKCGATYVDKEFLSWLEKLVGSEAYSKIPKEKLRHGSPLINQFERIKEHFSGVEEDMDIPLPPQCGITDDKENNIEDGILIVSSEQMKQFFAPSVDRTLELINGQVTAMRKAGKAAPKMVLIVGGFGRNRYLFNKIEDYCIERGILAKTPSFPWSAVVRGAVSRGLEGADSGLVDVRLARKHYGAIADEPFNSLVHIEEDKYLDKLTGRQMARGQMSWLVDKGERLPDQPPKKVSIELCVIFTPDEDRIFSSVLAGCDEDEAPKRYYNEAGSVYNVCRVRADLSSVPDHKFPKYRSGLNSTEYMVAEFTLEATFSGSVIDWHFIFEGKSYGSVSVSYDK